MESRTRYLQIRTVAAVMLTVLALMLALPAARAEVVRTGAEPWYRQVPAEVQQRAKVLFVLAVDAHQDLMRWSAIELYEQALALWDNPDIRWNLALALEDLGQYWRAYQQLNSALRWETALGPDRLREVHDRMRVLETQCLARIETYLEEPEAEITLDGKPWLRRANRRSMLVFPGEHYIAATKPGYFPATWTVSVKAGQQAYVALPMTRTELIEPRRWSAWKPWAVIEAGIAVAAVGAEFYGRGEVEHRLATGALAVGGTAIAAGLVLVWLNQPRAYRTEGRPSSKIKLTPILLPQRAELSASVRF